MRRCLVLLALLTGCSLFAQDIGNVPDSVISALDSFLSAEQRIELLKQGYLFRSVYNKENAVPRLAPLFAVPQTFAENRNKGNPTFLIEALYVHKKTQGSIKENLPHSSFHFKAGRAAILFEQPQEDADTLRSIIYY